MFAFAFMVLLIIGAALVAGLVIAIPILLFKKRLRLSALLLGITALVAAFPLGFWAEFAWNDCCGGPSTGRQGLGWLLGIVMGVIGIFLIFKSRKGKNKTLQK